MDGDLIQGTLQSLLQNRQQLQQNQQRAQQQQLGTMRTPLPQTGPIEQMISDYLTKYAANPGMGWSSMASAIGTQTERSRKADENQLLRMQAADEAEAKMAGDALKEQDLFAAKLQIGSRVGKGGASGIVTKMDKDGNLVTHNPTTGETKVVHSSQRGEWQRIWSKAYEKAVTEDMENPEGYANSVASTVLANSPGFNPQKEPIPSQTTPAQFQRLEPLPTMPGASTSTTLQVPQGQGSPNLNELTPTERSMANSLQGATSMAANPATAVQGQAQLGALRQQFPMQTTAQTIAPPSSEPAPATMQYKDSRTKEQQKSYGKEEGQELFKERKALSTAHEVNGRLMSQLNLLESIYNSPNIPEGELAGQVSAIRSGLRTLGVDVSDSVGMTDLAKAISTKMALVQKSSDGQNLLPGAMSNYEDQLLQKMAPVLTLTHEGRLALITFMKEVAKSNMRLSEEATRMASSNKDMLPPAWSKRKERLMLEEMARLKHLSDPLIKQYGSKE